MKRLFLLIALSLMSALGMAQTLDLDKSDDQPEFKRWSFLTGFERTCGETNMYNFSGVYGINFAGGHLFFGAGLSGSYIHSPGFSSTYTGKRIVDGKEVHTTEVWQEEVAVDKGIVNLVFDWRYQILTQYSCSPIFHWRFGNAFGCGDSFFSNNTGFCYNLKNNKQIEFTMGFMILNYKREYVKWSPDYEYCVLLNLGAAFKF